jgi:Fe2+ or Zn2+ uptake regulation protein
MLYHRYLLDDYLILKVLKEHSGITVYEINKKLEVIEMGRAWRTIYTDVNRLMKNGYVTVIGRKRRIHGVIRKYKNHPTRRRCGLSLGLTSQGFKRLYQLDFSIHICLSLSINGVKI